MNTEQNSFNPGDVKPLEVGFIQDNEHVQDEQLDESTPATVPDKPEQNQVAPVEPQTPDTTPVQALPQESEVYKNLQAAFTKASQKNSELQGRLEQMEARLANLSTTQQPAASTTPAHNFDELDKTADEFEELKPIADNMKRMQDQLDNQKAELDDTKTVIVKSDAQRNQEEHERNVMIAHPDARTIMNTIDFQGWLQRQPAYMQGLLNPGPSGGSTAEIIDLFTAYKAASGQPVIPVPPQKTPEELALEAARLAGAPTQTSPAPTFTTDSNNKRIYTNAEIGAMSFKEYASLADDIDLAAVEGRVLP